MVDLSSPEMRRLFDLMLPFIQADRGWIGLPPELAKVSIADLRFMAEMLQRTEDVTRAAEGHPELQQLDFTPILVKAGLYVTAARLVHDEACEPVREQLRKEDARYAAEGMDPERAGRLAAEHSSLERMFARLVASEPRQQRLQDRLIVQQAETDNIFDFALGIAASELGLRNAAAFYRAFNDAKAEEAGAGRAAAGRG